MTESFNAQRPCSKSIYICHGKSCKKRKTQHQQVCAQFPNATPIKCIGVCKGPVVLITEGPAHQKHTIFKKVRTANALLRLENFFRWDLISQKTNKNKLSERKTQNIRKKVQKRIAQLSSSEITWLL